MKLRASGWLAALLLNLFVPAVSAAQEPQRVVVSTDVGDDIDDAFALALLLNSPELQISGVASTWGDTGLRARLLQHLLQQVGRSEIPLAVGERGDSATPFSQARWAARGSTPEAFITASEMIVQQARRHPGQVSLLVLGPLTDAARALEQDPEGFAQLKQIVLMGGSLRVGYGKSDYRAANPPAAEYNIAADIDAARKVFAAGVPIVMLPLDATQVQLQEAERVALFAHGSALTDALAQLYYQWRDSDQPWASAAPTLFDVVPVAWLLRPGLCPMVQMHIEVDKRGFTRQTSAKPNAQVCLKLHKPALIEFYMQQLLRK